MDAFNIARVHRSLQLQKTSSQQSRENATRLTPAEIRSLNNSAAASRAGRQSHGNLQAQASVVEAIPSGHRTASRPNKATKNGDASLPTPPHSPIAKPRTSSHTSIPNGSLYKPKSQSVVQNAPAEAGATHLSSPAFNNHRGLPTYRGPEKTRTGSSTMLQRPSTEIVTNPLSMFSRPRQNTTFPSPETRKSEFQDNHNNLPHDIPKKSSIANTGFDRSDEPRNHPHLHELKKDGSSFETYTLPRSDGKTERISVQARNRDMVIDQSNTAHAEMQSQQKNDQNDRKGVKKRFSLNKSSDKNEAKAVKKTKRLGLPFASSSGGSTTDPLHEQTIDHHDEDHHPMHSPVKSNEILTVFVAAKDQGKDKDPNFAAVAGRCSCCGKLKKSAGHSNVLSPVLENDHLRPKFSFEINREDQLSGLSRSSSSSNHKNTPNISTSTTNSPAVQSSVTTREPTILPSSYVSESSDQRSSMNPSTTIGLVVTDVDQESELLRFGSLHGRRKKELKHEESITLKGEEEEKHENMDTAKPEQLSVPLPPAESATESATMPDQAMPDNVAGRMQNPSTSEVVPNTAHHEDEGLLPKEESSNPEGDIPSSGSQSQMDVDEGEPPSEQDRDPLPNLSLLEIVRPGWDRSNSPQGISKTKRPARDELLVLTHGGYRTFKQIATSAVEPRLIRSGTLMTEPAIGVRTAGLPAFNFVEQDKRKTGARLKSHVQHLQSLQASAKGPKQSHNSVRVQIQRPKPFQTLSQDSITRGDSRGRPSKEKTPQVWPGHGSCPKQVMTAEVIPQIGHGTRKSTDKKTEPSVTKGSFVDDNIRNGYDSQPKPLLPSEPLKATPQASVASVSPPTSPPKSNKSSRAAHKVDRGAAPPFQCFQTTSFGNRAMVGNFSEHPLMVSMPNQAVSSAPIPSGIGRSQIGQRTSNQIFQPSGAFLLPAIPHVASEVSLPHDKPESDGRSSGMPVEKDTDLADALTTNETTSPYHITLLNNPPTLESSKLPQPQILHTTPRPRSPQPASAESVQPSTSDSTNTDSADARPKTFPLQTSSLPLSFPMLTVDRESGDITFKPVSQTRSVDHPSAAKASTTFFSNTETGDQLNKRRHRTLSQPEDQSIQEADTRLERPPQFPSLLRSSSDTILKDQAEYKILKSALKSPSSTKYQSQVTNTPNSGQTTSDQRLTLNKDGDSSEAIFAHAKSTTPAEAVSSQTTNVLSLGPSDQQSALEVEHHRTPRTLSPQPPSSPTRESELVISEYDEQGFKRMKPKGTSKFLHSSKSHTAEFHIPINSTAQNNNNPSRPARLQALVRMPPVVQAVPARLIKPPPQMNSPLPTVITKSKQMVLPQKQSPPERKSPPRTGVQTSVRFSPELERSERPAGAPTPSSSNNVEGTSFNPVPDLATSSRETSAKDEALVDFSSLGSDFAGGFSIPDFTFNESGKHQRPSFNTHPNGRVTPTSKTNRARQVVAA